MNKTQKAHILVLGFGRTCVPRYVSYTTRRELLGCMVDIGLRCWLSGKESACQCRRRGFDPWVRKIPWRRKWLPTPVFLPGESHGDRSMTGYQSTGSQRVGYN